MLFVGELASDWIVALRDRVVGIVTRARRRRYSPCSDRQIGVHVDGLHERKRKRTFKARVAAAALTLGTCGGGSLRISDHEKDGG